VRSCTNRAARQSAQLRRKKRRSPISCAHFSKFFFSMKLRLARFAQPMIAHRARLSSRKTFFLRCRENACFPD
jgi:hypothetical protein